MPLQKFLNFTRLLSINMCLTCAVMHCWQIIFWGDVFVKLLQHLSAGSGPSTCLRSYLYKMAYHLVVDKARYSYRSAPIEVVDLLHHNPYSTELSLEDRMLFETVKRAIQNDLTDDQRHVVILRFLEGLSLKKTATILGKEVGILSIAHFMTH